jgi:tripartite-type tricarboxylate transporter receptor subunit TctC
MNRHAVLSVATLAAAAAMTAATAQEYPIKPVRVIVAWPPGGLVDIAGRVVGEKVQAALGQPMVIDNKPGAGGAIGAEAVARSAADGYSLLLTVSALTMNAALRPGTSFNIDSSFAPIVVAARTPSVVVVSPSSGINTLADLIARARARPGALTFASAGNGSPSHLYAELFKARLGLDVVHVPYKGAPPAMADQVAGRVDFQIANAAVALPQIRAGKVRALAVTSAARSDMFGDVPTMAEAGVPDFEVDQWIGYLAPAGTPRAIVERLAAEINKALALPDVRSTLERSGMLADGTSTPAGFAAYIKLEYAKWAGVVKGAQIKGD